MNKRKLKLNQFPFILYRKATLPINQVGVFGSKMQFIHQSLGCMKMSNIIIRILNIKDIVII